jgi:hypothetical protein
MGEWPAAGYKINGVITEGEKEIESLSKNIIFEDTPKD